MYIEKWLNGCRVTVSDWVGKDSDGKTPIRIGVEYFAPGSRLSAPTWERVVYLARRDELTVYDRLDSIVCAICNGSLPSVLSR